MAKYANLFCMNTNKLLDLAIKAVQASGEFLLALADVKAASSEGKDIKLYADKESERILLEHLAPTGLPVLSEESVSECTWVGGLRWIIDPIDGSYNLFKGLRDLCCVSVALWDDNKPVFGVLYRFAKDDLYVGVPGEGATLNGKAINASGVTDFSQASLATGFPVTTDFADPALQNRLALLGRFKKVRMLGTAALMCAFVGQGAVDVYSERGILLWDIAAALAIVKAAGGTYECAFLDNYKCNVAAYGNAELLTNVTNACGSLIA